MDKSMILKEIYKSRVLWAGLLLLTALWAVALVVTGRAVYGHARRELGQDLRLVVDTLAGVADERAARLAHGLGVVAALPELDRPPGAALPDRAALARLAQAAGLDGLALLEGEGQGATLVTGLSETALRLCRTPGAHLDDGQSPPLLVHAVPLAGEATGRWLCGALAMPTVAQLGLPAELAEALRVVWRARPALAPAPVEPVWQGRDDGRWLSLSRPLQLAGARHDVEARLPRRRLLRHWQRELWPYVTILTLLYLATVVSLLGVLLVRFMRQRWLHIRQAAFAGMAYTGNGVVVSDRQGRIVFFNQAAEQLIGRRRDEIAGQPAERVLRFQDRDGQPLPEPLTEALRRQTEVSAGCDAWLVDANGQRVAVHYSANPIHKGEHAAGAVLVVRDMHKERALVDELRVKSTRDEVTGLPNRAELLRVLRETLQRVQGAGGSAQLLYLDLDRFDVINEVHGLNGGDLLLGQIAGLLTTLVRPGDVVARLNGDEFAIVLAPADATYAARFADRLLQALRGHRFALAGTPVVLTGSLGIAPLNLQAQDAITALANAAAACHEAKRLGRNRWMRAADREAGRRRREIELGWLPRLRTALEKGAFALHAQPIEPVAGDVPPGRLGEVLLRLDEPGGTLASPREFLPVAEAYGLAEEIDRWVVETLFTRYRHHFAAPRGERDGFDLLTINLTRNALVSPDFLGFVTEAMERHHIDPRRVCFEVAERHLVDDRERALAFMTTLHGLGVQFMLDDFGTGMTSFGCLKDLPVGFVKINGAFVRAMEQDVGAYAMVHALNETAHFLGVRTVAEFVENAALQALVEEIGVDYVQGFGVAVPEPLRGGVVGLNASVA